jgi:hypothetical protein
MEATDLKMAEAIRFQLITVAASYKAGTAFGRSNGRVVGSNPIRGIDVCVRLTVFVTPVYK